MNAEVAGSNPVCPFPPERIGFAKQRANTRGKRCVSGFRTMARGVVQNEDAGLQTRYAGHEFRPHPPHKTATSNDRGGFFIENEGVIEYNLR